MSHASALPLPRRTPLPDVRVCPFCHRHVESLRRGQGHKYPCPCLAIHEPRDYEQQDREARELRECGCPAEHVWSCWDNPYRTEE